MGALLEVSNLRAWYGESQALHGVNLHVDQGETCLLYTSPSPRDS